MFLRVTAGLLLLSAMANSTANSSTTANMLLVIQKGSDSLGIFDPASGHEIASVPEGGTTGHEVAASLDGRYAYVPIYGNSGVGKPGTDGHNIVVIDLQEHKIAGNLDFNHPVRPHLPTINPKDGLLYTTTELDHSITILDPKLTAAGTLKIIGSIPTSQAESHMFAISHDGRRGYTANVGPGTVSVLDLATRKTIAVIPVSGNIQRVTISRDDRYVFTSDQTEKRLAVIDTGTNKLKQWIALPDIGYGSFATADNHWLLLTLPARNQVAAIDLTTMKVAHTIDVPSNPIVVMARPDSKAAFVSCAGSDQVAEIDLTSWKVSQLIHTGKSPDGLAWVAAR